MLRKPICAPRCWGYAAQFLLSRGEPALASLRLALGAVAVAAAVIRDGLLAAAWTIIDLSAQRRSAAWSDGAQHLPLLIAEMLAVLVHQPGAGACIRSASSRVGRLILVCAVSAKVAVEPGPRRQSS